MIGKADECKRRCMPCLEVRNEQMWFYKKQMIISLNEIRNASNKFEEIETNIILNMSLNTCYTIQINIW